MPRIRVRDRAEYQKEYRQRTKEARAEYDRNRYQENKEEIQAYRKEWRQRQYRITDWCIETYGSTPCLDCGGSFPWECMDFDHRPEEQKEFAISTKADRRATPARLVEIQKEIAKCDLVCANCHRTRTKERHHEAE